MCTRANIPWNDWLAKRSQRGPIFIFLFILIRLFIDFNALIIIVFLSGQLPRLQ